jgi:hypothetical protein
MKVAVNIPVNVAMATFTLHFMVGDDNRARRTAG